MLRKVVIHLFHADESSLNTGAHVSERIRQVKEEQRVALGSLRLWPGGKSACGPSSSGVSGHSRKPGNVWCACACLPDYRGGDG